MTLISPQPAEFGDVALALLTLAGPERANDVRTVSDGVYGLGFEVPEDLHELWVALITSGDMPPEDGAPETEARVKRPYTRRAKTATEVATELETATGEEPSDG